MRNQNNLNPLLVGIAAFIVFLMIYVVNPPENPDSITIFIIGIFCALLCAFCATYFSGSATLFQDISIFNGKNGKIRIKGKFLDGFSIFALVLIIFIFYIFNIYNPPLSSESTGKYYFPESPNGKYEAVLVGSDKIQNYHIKDQTTGEIIFQTKGPYGKQNDVKAAMFSDDSQQFAAAYHFSHEGGYTWIGVWDVNTGNMIRTEKVDGYTTDISWIFD